MKELLEDILFTGLGTLVVTKEKAEELIDKMVKQGEVSKKEGRDVIEKFKRKTEESRKVLNERISKEVEQRLEHIGVVSKNEVQELRFEINQLKQELQELKEKNRENDGQEDGL